MNLKNISAYAVCLEPLAKCPVEYTVIRLEVSGVSWRAHLENCRVLANSTKESLPGSVGYETKTRTTPGQIKNTYLLHTFTNTFMDT